MQTRIVYMVLRRRYTVAFVQHGCVSITVPGFVVFMQQGEGKRLAKGSGMLFRRSVFKSLFISINKLTVIAIA